MSDDEPDASTDVPVDSQPESEGNGECFVIAPIGDPRTETQRQTDGLLNEAIRPVVEEELGLDVTAAHELPEAGSITRQVIQRLLEAELVIADLTGLNANVMYELAVRHAEGRPVVPIAEKGTSLPFDITTERTIFYEESFHGLNELKPKLEDAARPALEDEEPDNPIYRAQQDFQMREATAGDDAMQYIMDRLDNLESKITPRIGENRPPSSDTFFSITPQDADTVQPEGSTLTLLSPVDLESTEELVRRLQQDAEIWEVSYTEESDGQVCLHIRYGIGPTREEVAMMAHSLSKQIKKEKSSK